jgi:hypothetical protein
MTFTKRNTITEDIKKYCHLANEIDTMEVTEWTNGEGFDIALCKKSGDTLLSLTYGELELISILTKIKFEADEEETQ